MKVDRPELISIHNSMCRAARTLMDKKNDDYADKDAVFGNLDVVESVFRNRVTTEQGITIRMCDKLARLATACQRDLRVKDEGTMDTLLDVINYSVLYAAKRIQRDDPSFLDHLIVDEEICTTIGIELGSQPETIAPDQPHRVYISGPFSNGGTLELAARELGTRKAIEMGRTITERGHFIYVPHAATGPYDGDWDYETFMELDFTFIRKWATVLYRLPGESPGVEREVALARELGIPVWGHPMDIPCLVNVPCA